MTDEEVITEFGKLVRSTLKVRGRIEHVNHDLQETAVRFDKITLSRGFFINGEVRVTVFSYVHGDRVFFETSGGPGIYFGNVDNDYDVGAIRELLPILHKLTVLDQLADV